PSSTPNLPSICRRCGSSSCRSPTTSRKFSPFSFFALRRTPTSTLFPYTTLFRSAEKAAELQGLIDPRHEGSPLEQLAHSLDAYRSEEHTSELQSRGHLVCRLLLEKKKKRGHRQFASLGLGCDAHRWRRPGDTGRR